MRELSVLEVSRLADVSVRTLHHYDRIGLLKPAKRSDSGYRYYGEDELFRLQQILFFRELDLSLADIQLWLDAPRYDRKNALLFHREQLQQRRKRLDNLLITVDETLHQLQKEASMDNYEMLYKGFSKDKVAAMEAEVTEKYGQNALQLSKDTINSLPKAKLEAIQAELNQLNVQLSQSMHLFVDDPRVQALVEKHRELSSAFYPATLEVYAAWGKMYVEDKRFTATYDKVKPGLADFLSRAIAHYCQKEEV